MTRALIHICLAAGLTALFLSQAYSQEQAPINPTSKPQGNKVEFNPPGSQPPKAGPEVTPSAPIDTASKPPVENMPSLGDSVSSKPSNLLQGIIEEFNYSPDGKRDPFLALRAQEGGVTIGPIFPLQRFDLDQLKLVGVIWDVKNPKAMILDPTGKSYVVKLNERLGRNSGYVARIREGELVIVESFTGNDGKVSYQTRFIKLQNE